MVEVEWRDHAGKRWRTTALLEDISSTGACLQAESAIPLGAAIRWEGSGKQFQGEVRYCVYREIGYFVGVEFLCDSRWSKKDYRPPHLLDLEPFAEQGKSGKAE